MNKEKIIKSSEDYSRIISNNQSVKNKYYSIYYIKSDKNLYGITVPKKVGKAHIRNKLKRQLKNIIIKNEKEIKKSYNYVIIIKEPSNNLSYQDKEEEIINLFKKVRDEIEK